MGLKVYKEKVDDNFFNWYVYEESTPNNQSLVYTIDKEKKKIELFPYENPNFGRESVVKKIIVNGFDKLPPEFNPKGYLGGGALYYLDKKAEELGLDQILVEKIKEFTVRKYREKYKLIFNYKDFAKLVNKLREIKTESSRERSEYANEFFQNVFPKYYESQNLSSQIRARRVIDNLDDDIIQHFNPSALQKLEDFYVQILEKKYKTIKKDELVTKTKVKVDIIALETIIKKFQKLLNRKSSEKEWGKFLQTYLFVVDLKYIHCIPELNLVLGGQRYVDFGLLDSQFNFDIFEIKKPDSTLLAKKKDRGNYYFSTECIKAITQAEKYLYYANSKKDSLEKDIKRQKDIKNISIVQPKAFLLMGSSNELDTDAKKEDFRILRQSLKNIEIILYDELLERLKNCKHSANYTLTK